MFKLPTRTVPMHTKVYERTFFGDDFYQFLYLPSYMDALNERGHKAQISLMTDSTFERFAVIYRED